MCTSKVKENTRKYFVCSLLLVACVFVTSNYCSGSEQENAPVVIELFTSQGCSGCPQAEYLLKTLAEEYGPEILPLAYHVDYWDYIGWVDPYSFPEATERQREYQKILKNKTIYTPQAVIQGELVQPASSRKSMELGILKYQNLSRPMLDLKIDYSLVLKKATLTIDVPETISKENIKILVVYFENGFPVYVTRGENAGRTLPIHHAVLKIQAVKLNDAHYYQIPIELPDDWTASLTGVAVLVEDQKHRILTAGSIFPISLN